MKKKLGICVIIVLVVSLSAYTLQKTAKVEFEREVASTVLESVSEPNIQTDSQEPILERGMSAENEASQQIEDYLIEFAEVYLSGNKTMLQNFLVDFYQWEEIPYPYDGSEAVLAPINGIEVYTEKLHENGVCQVSIPFKKTANEDYYIYLTVELVQHENKLQVQFYGLEG